MKGENNKHKHIGNTQSTHIKIWKIWFPFLFKLSCETKNGSSLQHCYGCVTLNEGYHYANILICRLNSNWKKCQHSNFCHVQTCTSKLNICLFPQHVKKSQEAYSVWFCACLWELYKMWIQSESDFIKLHNFLFNHSNIRAGQGHRTVRSETINPLDATEW